MNLNSTIFIQFLIFFILLFFVIKYIWPNFINILDERFKLIQQELIIKKNNKINYINNNKNLILKLNKIKFKKIQYLNEIKQKYKKIINKAKKKAKKKAFFIIKKANKNINEIITKNKKEINNLIIKKSILIIEKIFKFKVNKKIYYSLIKELFNS